MSLLPVRCRRQAVVRRQYRRASVVQHSSDSRDQPRSATTDTTRDGTAKRPSRHRLAGGHPEPRSVDGPVAYDVPEVMRRLAITRPTLYYFLRSGELRSFRLGRRRLISASALDEFIRARESAEAG